MELREKIAEIFADAFESGANGGGGSFAEEEYTARILAIPEIRNALASVALLEDERKMFANYRADMGRLINGNEKA